MSGTFFEDLQNKNFLYFELFNTVLNIIFIQFINIRICYTTFIHFDRHRAKVKNKDAEPKLKLDNAYSKSKLFLRIKIGGERERYQIE